MILKRLGLNDVGSPVQVGGNDWDELYDYLNNINLSGKSAIVITPTTEKNHTINLSDNTLTDTGIALGDLLMFDGTRVKRRSKGTALQQIRVNAAGTDHEYFTPSATGAHKDTHVAVGGSDAFVKGDEINAASRYLEDIADPASDAQRIWLENATANLKYWGDEGTPVKHTVERQTNKAAASGYCDLDSSIMVPKARINLDPLYRYLENPVNAKTGLLIPVSSTLADNLSGLWKMNSSVNGTVAIQALDTTEGKPLRCTSGSANGNNTGINIYDSATCRAFNPLLAIRFRLQTLTLMRFFAGFQSNTASTFINSDTPLANLSGFGFAKLTTSANWQIVRNDGDATQDTQDTGIAADTNWHTLIIWAEAANNRFGYSLDGAAAVYFTTEIPAATTALTYSTIVYTNESFSKWIEYVSGLLRSDK